jgi:N-acyl-D-aspartate/D-glutamate deacylase
VVEEKLETTFMQAENNVDPEAMREILNYPNALIGLSDGGAHVQFHGGYGFSTRFLGEWVREKQIMSLEKAVRRLTFDSASHFGLYDRGLLRPGMAADITIFDPETVKPMPEFVVHDFPAGGWRFKEPAAGIYATFVNGQMLMKEGKHTGNLPGRVLRNSRYQAAHA